MKAGPAAIPRVRLQLPMGRSAAVSGNSRCVVSSRRRTPELGRPARPWPGKGGTRRPLSPGRRTRRRGARSRGPAGVGSPSRAMGHGPENESREAYEAKVSALGRAYVDALLSGDQVAAEIAIREAMDAGLGTAQIDDEIIAPALWHVGELWERGEISVADEHVATEISMRVLALQREAQRVARPAATAGSCWPLRPGSNTSSRCAWSTTSCATPATTWRCSAPTCPPRPWPAREPPPTARGLPDLDDARRGGRGADGDRTRPTAMAWRGVRRRRQRAERARAPAARDRRLPARLRCRGGRRRDGQARRAELTRDARAREAWRSHAPGVLEPR